MPGLKQRAGGGNRSQKGFHAASHSTDKPKNSGENIRHNVAQATAGLKRKRIEDDADEKEKVQPTIPAKEDKYTVLATAALATMDAHHPKRWKLETKVASHHDRKAQWLSLSEEEKAARAKEAKASKRAMKKLSKGKGGTSKGGEGEGKAGKGSKVERAVAEAQRGKEMDEMLAQKFKDAGLPSYLTSSEWLSKAQAASIAGAVSEKVGRIYRRTYGCQRLGLDVKTGQPVEA